MFHVSHAVLAAVANGETMKWTTNISPLIKEFELRKNPVIIRVNKFDEKSAKEFQESVAQAHNTGQRVIPVVISSPGGQVYHLTSMLDAIEDSELPVATIADGLAMSCGAVLLSAGSDGMRFATPNATIMVHDVSSMNWGKVEDLKTSAEEADRLNNLIMGYMSRQCGKKENYFIKELHKQGRTDWFMDAAAAKKIGLINHIRKPTLRINIGVEIDFE